ncbi:hypothetical protein VZT92_022917 [Zoarces viviparus]|uniref:Uncharacterized protein n=1 Tax=Zoarces viviparus TaxID=48416 RepID=A0AAW1E5R3_ZOAVI
MAINQGWMGPWELTSWSRLIEDVFCDSTVPIHDLAPVPVEAGARGTNLLYSITALDASGHTGVRTKEKSKIFTVTPVGWRRDGVMQIPGSWAARAGTPSWPEHTIRVMVTVKTVMVPFKGVYSIRVAITRAGPPPDPLTDARGLKAWARESFHRLMSGRKDRCTSEEKKT